MRKSNAICMALIDGTPRDTMTGRIVAIDNYLYGAIDKASRKIVAYLLTLGADPNDSHGGYSSPLQRAKIYRPIFNRSRVALRRLIQPLIGEGKVEIIVH